VGYTLASAGAQISAQVAAMLTNPDYTSAVGIAPTLDAARLRGVVLCCGIYDLTALRTTGPFRDLLAAVGWAYSGTRDYRANTFLTSTTAVPGHVTSAFPAGFITVGNADPLVRLSGAGGRPA